MRSLNVSQAGYGSVLTCIARLGHELESNVKSRLSLSQRMPRTGLERRQFFRSSSARIRQSQREVNVAL